MLVIGFETGKLQKARSVRKINAQIPKKLINAPIVSYKTDGKKNFRRIKESSAVIQKNEIFNDFLIKVVTDSKRIIIKQ
jgi:hypothetical protein